ncbi:hypothetical protein IWW48_004028 [Coemansia sp. RSA 1200]|nr:hypothetical protein IWW48_004028 [Coemansia sp. RSA 1200]
MQPLHNSPNMLGIRQAAIISGGVGKIYNPTEEITNARTAILYKDNSQTYCEVMMSSQTIGIAAASCFDYINNEVNPNIGYTVLVSTGTTESGVSGAYKATKVTHHPDYNPDTYANNIAVMQFTAVPGFEFTKAIADWPAEWKQYFFVHRSLTNVMPYTFNEPKVSVVDVGADDTSGCTSASAIYAANMGNYICNMLTVPSYVNTDCVAPYGSVYGVADPNLAQLGAVFSHSAIYGTSGYCGKGPIYNYYLILRNYIPWIESVSQTTVSTYHISGSTSYTAASDSGYVMDNPGNTVSGVYVVGNYTAGTMVSAVPAAASTSAVRAALQQSEVENVVSTELITFTTTDIVSSTDVHLVTETESATATISETTTLETTDVVLATSTIETTSTVLVTSTTVELSIMTVTATAVIPTAIGATNSIISPLIISVTDVSIMTVGNGNVETTTVTVHNTVVVSEGAASVQTIGGQTITVTETVTEEAATVYLTNVVTETEAAVTSTSTATFTDFDFITIYTTESFVSTVTIVSTEPKPTAAPTESLSSKQPQSTVTSELSSAEIVDSDTYCEVAISNENTGIVAASCIDYAGGNVNENVKYSVVVSPNLQLEIPRLFNVDHIKPHPDYNPETFANNIAVLQMSMIPAVSILKGLSDRIEDWEYNVFHHRSLINGSPKGFEFNLPATTTAKPADQDVSACSEASAIYSLNPSDFICNSATLKSYVDASCVAPYGSVYGPVEGQGLLLCALFSHSVVYSDDGYCGDGKIYNYYVILRNYIPWIKSVAVGSVQTYNTQTGNGYVGPTDANYKMREPTANVAGVVLMGNYTLNPPPPSSPNLLESTNSTVSDPASAIWQEDPPVNANVSNQEEEEVVTSIVLSTIIETDIFSSTYVQSSTEINPVTTTIPETTTIDVTDYVSETSMLLTTSTVMVTLTTVELSIVTVTATEIVPTVIGATNSIISPVIISVTDVSILTVGNGEVVTVTETVYNNLPATGDTAVVDPVSCDAMFATETVALDASTVYVTDTVTEPGDVFTSVSTATFTDYEFITIYTTDTVVSVADVVLPASEPSKTPTAVESSEYPEASTSNESDEGTGNTDSIKDNQKGNHGMPPWAIALLVFLILAAVALALWLYLRWRRRQREIKRAEMLAFGAPMQLPQRYRVINWLNRRLWRRPPSRVDSPPDYRSSIN